MANQIMTQVNACISMALAVLWIILVFAPITWFSGMMTAFSWKVSLLRVHVDAGIAGAFISWTGSLISDKKGAWFRDNLNHSVSMFDWTENICAWNDEWCRQWSMALYGSLIMVVLGLLAATLLVSGSLLAYYYAHTHATHTGRMGALVCLVTAPGCATVGLLLYVLLTFWVDFQSIVNPVNMTGHYTVGFYLACALIVFSWLPLFIHVTFSKVDEFEKYGDNDAFVVETGAYGSGYGAAQSALPVAPQAPMAFAGGPQDMGYTDYNTAPQGPYTGGPMAVPAGPSMVGLPMAGPPMAGLGAPAWSMAGPPTAGLGAPAW